MARQPEVFVRELTVEEGQRLRRISRTGKDRVRLRRATIVLASAAGRPVPDVAELFAASQRYVRQVIHDFNTHGFAALNPKWSGSRPAATTAETRERICRIARCCPTDLGLPFATWSLAKLGAYLVEHEQLPAVSHETLRKVLKAGGVSFQVTKTWKASKDPDFTVKKDCILDLYDRPPADGRVVCVDEFGPHGKGWSGRCRDVWRWR